MKRKAHGSIHTNDVVDNKNTKALREKIFSPEGSFFMGKVEDVISTRAPPLGPRGGVWGGFSAHKGVFCFAYFPPFRVNKKLGINIKGSA